MAVAEARRSSSHYGGSHRPSLSPRNLIPEEGDSSTQDHLTVSNTSLLSEGKAEGGGGWREEEGAGGEEEKKPGLKDKIKGVYQRLGLKHLLPLFALIVYSLAGAGIFYVIEEPTTRKLTEDCERHSRYARTQVERRMWELHLENFSKPQVLIRARLAMDWYENEREDCDRSKYIMDFWSAMFYCGTLYTTIGYGTIVPFTKTGKIVTMLYSIIGIPLVFIILNSFGDWISKKIIVVWFWTVDFVKRMRKSVSKLFRIRRIKRKRLPSGEFQDEVAEEVYTPPEQPQGERQLHELPILVALGLTVAWMFLCAAIFCVWEDWTYFLSFYFFFVSLTTIGLGDLVPERYDYMMLNFWLLLVGLSLVSMCIQVAQAKVENFVEMTILRNFKNLQEIQMAEATGLVSSVVGLSPGRPESGHSEDPEAGAPSIATAVPTQQEPEWVKAFLGTRGRRRLEKTRNAKTGIKVKGTQVFPGDFPLEEKAVQTEACPDWNSLISEQRTEIGGLLSQNRDLLAQIEQLKSSLSAVDYLVPPSLCFDSLAVIHNGHSKHNGLIPPHLQNGGENRKAIPYREFVHKSRKSPSLDQGRELLDELSFRIEECRSLVSKRN